MINSKFTILTFYQFKKIQDISKIKKVKISKEKLAKSIKLITPNSWKPIFP